MTKTKGILLPIAIGLLLAIGLTFSGHLTAAEQHRLDLWGTTDIAIEGTN